MKVAVVGSRDPNDQEFIYNTLNQLKDTGQIRFDEVVSGGARGTDYYAGLWAIDHNIPFKAFLPDREIGFPAALFARNTSIVERSEAVVAFFDDKPTQGTMDTVKKAQKAGKLVLVYYKNPRRTVLDFT